MNDFKVKDSSGSPAQEGERGYPAAVQQLSEKWRSLQQRGSAPKSGSFLERNFLALGVGIALLIIAFLIVIGGFAFLVWNAG